MEKLWHFPLSTSINIAQQVVQTDPTASNMMAKTRCWKGFDISQAIPTLVNIAKQGVDNIPTLVNIAWQGVHTIPT